MKMLGEASPVVLVVLLVAVADVSTQPGSPAIKRYGLPENIVTQLDNLDKNGGQWEHTFLETLKDSIKQKLEESAEIYGMDYVKEDQNEYYCSPKGNVQFQIKDFIGPVQNIFSMELMYTIKFANVVRFRQTASNHLSRTTVKTEEVNICLFDTPNIIAKFKVNNFDKTNTERYRCSVLLTDLDPSDINTEDQRASQSWSCKDNEGMKIATQFWLGIKNKFMANLPTMVKRSVIKKILEEESWMCVSDELKSQYPNGAENIRDNEIKRIEDYHKLCC